MSQPSPPEDHRRKSIIDVLAAAWARRAPATNSTDPHPPAGPPGTAAAPPPGNPAAPLSPGAAALARPGNAANPSTRRLPRVAVWTAWAGGLTLAGVAVLGARDEPRVYGETPWTGPAITDVQAQIDVHSRTDAASQVDIEKLRETLLRAERARTPEAATPPAGGGLVRQGDTRLSYAGPAGERARITILRVGDPVPGGPHTQRIDPASGDRLIVVELTVENIGAIQMSAGIEDHVWLFDDEGNEFTYDEDRTEAANGPDMLCPGDTMIRTIVFQVDPSATGLHALVA